MVLLDNIVTYGYTRVLRDAVESQMELFDASLRQGPRSIDPEVAKFLEPMLALAQRIEV